MLKSEALVESSSGAEESIISLSIANMPTDPCARFARLFALRPRWALPDLEPYLADLQVCSVLYLQRSEQYATRMMSHGWQPYTEYTNLHVGLLRMH